MVEIKTEYEGQLHCNAHHGPSGTTIGTDAPKDNMGRGEAFSPTDLVATALGTCMLTTMGIVAQRQNLDMSGATIRIEKHMTTSGPRKIAKLPCEIRIPHTYGDDDRQRLENAALTCPVKKSLAAEVDVPVVFSWGN